MASFEIFKCIENMALELDFNNLQNNHFNSNYN